MAMVNVVSVAAFPADLLAQADRLGPKVDNHLALMLHSVK